VTGGYGSVYPATLSCRRRRAAVPLAAARGIVPATGAPAGAHVEVSAEGAKAGTGGSQGGRCAVECDVPVGPTR
jgi:hypothetical protein